MAIGVSCRSPWTLVSVLSIHRTFTPFILTHPATLRHLLGSIKTELQRYTRQATGFRLLLNQSFVRPPSPPLPLPKSRPQLTGMPRTEQNAPPPAALRRAHAAVGGHRARGARPERRGASRL